MKSLRKTIERILKIEPALGEQLNPIKDKWDRYPHRVMLYWKQLLKVLNSDNVMQHPKREEIRKVLLPRIRAVKKLHSFEPVGPDEKIIGAISEDIACRITRHDRHYIEWAKKEVEARITHNDNLINLLSREYALLDIEQKKLWIMLKDHFSLWPHAGSYRIKEKDHMLVLTRINPVGQSAQPPGFNPEVIRQFFRQLGLELPPLPPNNED